MTTLVMIAQLILSLSILVVLHELGHFLPAKWFKTRVEKFYLFFNPWFELFKFKKGETEYGVGWLPLGGYVKIAGMIDESMDKEQMAAPPKPWEFRSKKAWQRLIIMLGGVTVNFILGILIFMGMNLFWGKNYVPSENISHGIYVDTVGAKIGLQDGDQIVSLDGKPFEKFNRLDVIFPVVTKDLKEIGVKRNGVNTTIKVDPALSKEVGNSLKDNEIFNVRLQNIIDTMIQDAPAYKAGLRKGDHIVAVNGKEAIWHHQFQNAMKDNEGEAIAVNVNRDGQILNFNITPDDQGKIGYFPVFPKTNHIAYNFGSSAVQGWKDAWGFLNRQRKLLGMIATGKLDAKKNLGSIITIGKQFGGIWDWKRFWTLTASLSMILGFMNLLPIPALDGGHVMFLLWEVVTGRKPNDKVVEYATYVGFFILLAFMIFVLGLDVINNIFN
ncbi:MAG: RIP metalloprotease RseP [Bacteroidota bacterium]